MNRPYFVFWELQCPAIYCVNWSCSPLCGWCLPCCLWALHWALLGVWKTGAWPSMRRALCARKRIWWWPWCKLAMCANCLLPSKNLKTKCKIWPIWKMALWAQRYKTVICNSSIRCKLDLHNSRPKFWPCKKMNPCPIPCCKKPKSLWTASMPWWKALNMKTPVAYKTCARHSFCWCLRWWLPHWWLCSCWISFWYSLHWLCKKAYGSSAKSNFQSLSSCPCKPSFILWPTSLTNGQTVYRPTLRAWVANYSKRLKA